MLSSQSCLVQWVQRRGCAGGSPLPSLLLQKKSKVHYHIAVIINYLGHCISLVALLVAFVLLSLVRMLRSNLHSIHKNLIAALFFSQLIFMVGINQTENPVRPLSSVRHGLP